MSEAMTNTEIEDVLSSIRRLVAQETRPAPERLVLTAELRVGQANLTVPPTGLGASPTALSLAATPISRPEPEPAEPQVSAVAAPEPDEAAAAPVNPIAANVAHLIAKQPEVTVPQPESAPEVATTAAIEVAAPAPETPVTLDRDGLEATISALEAALGPTAPAPEMAPQAAAAPGDEASSEQDVTLIDEGDLEILVARLVRNELRGQLGERITQQVRRLVRAEISRVLDERKLLG
jgi:hypothetical protein